MAVRVIVRKRPVQADQMDVLEVHSPVVVVHEQKVKVDLTRYEYAHSYAYDDTFSEEESTAQLYERSVHGLVSNMFEGGTSTAFCFGQTASGSPLHCDCIPIHQNKLVTTFVCPHFI